MSSLSPVIEESLQKLQDDISAIKRGGSHQSPKPHKLLLLLAVLDLAENGLIDDNKIYLNDRLTTFFEKRFRQIAKDNDWCQLGPPFFHLRSSGFWHHRIREGREKEYSDLKTTGGGTKRILDNIEYAFLSPEAFSVVSDHTARQKLREFINVLVDDNDSLSISEHFKMTERIGTMFHESFSLSRHAVGSVISVINEGDITGGLQATLRSQTHLGKNYIKSMPQYARGCGFLTMDNQLTVFGARALQFDPLFETPTTQWLMHYYLSAPHGPGPAFWHEFVRTRFRYGDEFSKNSLAEQLVDFFRVTTSRTLNLNSANSTANAFIGTYAKDDGLGRLGFVDNYEDRFRVLEPDPPPLWVFAVALLDYWHHQFPARGATINLEELYADGGLTSIFMIGAGRVNSYLRTLQQEGIVDVFRVAPPYQVALLNPDPSFPLARLYTSDDTY